MPWWLQVIICTIILIAYGRFIIWFYHYRNKREVRKFMTWMQVKFPDAVLTYKAVSDISERDAFHKLIDQMQNGGSE